MASNGSRSSTGSWIFSIKAVVASSVVVSTAVMLRISASSILRFLSSEVPKLYGSLISWLTPPYLYLVINGIIISIAASSRFQKSAYDDRDLVGSGSAPSAVNPPVMKQEFVVPPLEYEEKVEEEVQPEFVVPEEYGIAVDDRVLEEEELKKEEKEDFVISRSSWTPKSGESTEIPTEYSFLTEKPLVSARLGRRKSLKASPEGGDNIAILAESRYLPEGNTVVNAPGPGNLTSGDGKSLKASPEAGKALGVARPKRNETLESTWKTITDGRPVPLTRHLRKSDTWEVHHGRPARDDPSPSPLMRKSETFNDRGSLRPPTPPPPPPPLGCSPAARLRKEPSLGQDDLNRRVEAFIKKFNEEMRLQRQESFVHYMDMINRGSQ